MIRTTCEGINHALLNVAGPLSIPNNGKKVFKLSPNPRGTKNVFSDIRELSIQIYMYVLSLSCLAMGINLVWDKGPHD